MYVFIFPSTLCIGNFLLLSKGILSVFFLLIWHTLLIDYFQEVRILLVFSFFYGIFSRLAVGVIFFTLQIVSCFFYTIRIIE